MRRTQGLRSRRTEAQSRPLPPGGWATFPAGPPSGSLGFPFVSSAALREHRWWNSRGSVPAAPLSHQKTADQRRRTALPLTPPVSLGREEKRSLPSAASGRWFQSGDLAVRGPQLQPVTRLLTARSPNQQPGRPRGMCQKGRVAGPPQTFRVEDGISTRPQLVLGAGGWGRAGCGLKTTSSQTAQRPRDLPGARSGAGRRAALRTEGV